MRRRTSKRFIEIIEFDGMIQADEPSVGVY